MIDLFVSAALILSLDQWSKRMIELQVGDRCIPLGRAVRLKRVASTRERYSQSGARVALVVVWVAALASALVLHNSGSGFRSRAAMLGLGAAFGGAAGNLIDILRTRAVADFIDFGWWPVFNIADIAIVAGLVVAFVPA